MTQLIKEKTLLYLISSGNSEGDEAGLSSCSDENNEIKNILVHNNNNG
jgi:hypothetical protein